MQYWLLQEEILSLLPVFLFIVFMSQHFFCVTSQLCMKLILMFPLNFMSLFTLWIVLKISLFDARWPFLCYFSLPSQHLKVVSWLWWHWMEYNKIKKWAWKKRNKTKKYPFLMCGRRIDERDFIMFWMLVHILQFCLCNK